MTILIMGLATLNIYWYKEINYCYPQVKQCKGMTAYGLKFEATLAQGVEYEISICRTHY